MTTPHSDQPGFGLALGGGASHGFAHLGVLEALAAHDLKPTHLTGTSIGAVIAALYAFGLDPREIHTALAQLDWWQLSNLSLSRHGFMDNAGMADFVREHIGTHEFADAPLPLAFVATDLARRSKVILDSGEVAEAARISASIPGLYIPVTRGDQILADGGLVENVPISPLVEQGVNCILAIDLNGDTRRRAPDGAIDNLITAFDVAIDTLTRIQLAGADVVLSLDLGDYSRTTARDADALFDAGYQACNARVPAIREQLESSRRGLLWRLLRSITPSRQHAGNGSHQQA